MKNGSDQNGFTLVEVIAAIAVFAFGILALYRLQTSAVHGNLVANNLTQATSLAENKLEELTALNFAGPAYTNANPLLLDANGNGTTVAPPVCNGLDDTIAGATPISDNTIPGLPAIKRCGGSAAADHTLNYTAPNGKIYNIYWNIADGQNLANSKTIRVIVTWGDEKSTLHRTALTSTMVSTK